MFNETTFDSWQIRSTNIVVLLNELLEMVDVVDLVKQAHPNIKYVLEETRKVAGRDVIIKEYYPFLKHHLEKLETEYQKAVSKNNDVDLTNFRRLLQVVIGNISGYKDKLIDRILSVLRATPEKYKVDLDELMGSYAVEVKSLGYSNKFLRDKFETLIDSKTRDFHERFLKLNKSLSGKENKYDCLFFINFSEELLNIDFSEINISKFRPTRFRNSDEEKFYSIDSQSIVAKVRVRATDIFSAREKAEKKLETLFSVSQIFLIEKKYIIKHQEALVILDDGTPIIVDKDESRLQYVKPSRDPLKNINDLAIVIHALGEEDKNQLNASLQYHKLSLSAQNDEARLVNLWIALESLILEDNKSSIKEISNYISTIDVLGYIYRLMRAQPISFKKIWKGNDTSILRSSLEYSNEHFLDARDMLKIILDNETGETLTRFTSLIKESPLLIYRVERIRSQILGNPKRLLKSLQTHKENVEWQVYRIYRMRNLIMHRGESNKDIRQLIQHLHTYYNITINTIIHDLKNNSGWRIANVLEHRRRIYDFYVERLKNYESAPLSMEEILNSEKCLFSKTKNPAWSVTN
ncbi:MAG: hypothetical protein M1495_12835 [Bacteroidetes bacterium]|nr:hypothetical protein [Bacteroidota bacterium]